MNIATKLTMLRVLLIPFFMISFLWQPPGSSLNADWGKVIAAILFIIGAITDYYDGYLARKYKQVTTFGKFMDPIADKLLVSTALIVMSEHRDITFTPSWIAVLIIAREFSVTGLRLICAEKGKIIVASNAGKLKTAAQMSAIITCLVFICIRIVLTSSGNLEYLAIFMKYYGTIISILMYFAAITTVYSGYDYFKKNWQFLDE